jgi:hypothetical protein
VDKQFILLHDLNKKMKELELVNSGFIRDRERLEYQLKVLDCKLLYFCVLQAFM